MGMDVIGKNPKSEKGEYFRNSVWGWRPLWEYCVDVGGDIIPADEAVNGQYNDCWGLDGKGAKRLARRLHQKLDSGHTKQYAAEREEHLKSMPDESCATCGGTGKRAKGREACSGCDGKGKERPFATHYPFEEENVREFADFLNDSGGFEIC